MAPREPVQHGDGDIGWLGAESAVDGHGRLIKAAKWALPLTRKPPFAKLCVQQAKSSLRIFAAHIQLQQAGIPYAIHLPMWVLRTPWRASGRHGRVC